MRRAGLPLSITDRRLECRTAIRNHWTKFRISKVNAVGPNNKARDGERRRIQWTAGKNAGFSTAAKTWLPVADEYQERNVATETNTPGCLLNYDEALIKLSPGKQRSAAW